MRKQQNTEEKLFTVIHFVADEVAVIQWLDFFPVQKTRLLSISLLIVNCFTKERRGQV